MAVKENKVRKLATLEREEWAEIEEIRFAGRFRTESEAMRFLLMLGCQAYRDGIELKAATPPEPTTQE